MEEERCMRSVGLGSREQQIGNQSWKHVRSILLQITPERWLLSSTSKDHWHKRFTTITECMCLAGIEVTVLPKALRDITNCWMSGSIFSRFWIMELTAASLFQSVIRRLFYLEESREKTWKGPSLGWFTIWRIHSVRNFFSQPWSTRRF